MGLAFHDQVFSHLSELQFHVGKGLAKLGAEQWQVIGHAHFKTVRVALGGGD
jgi:hypothetical protein